MSYRSKIWHPYTRFSELEEGAIPVIVRGDGIHLFDEEGNRYIDGISSWWCCNLGHGHPRVVEAIREQANVLQHSILGNLSHPNAMHLAERLAALMPDAGRHVHFASDGASANEAAIKIAVQYFHNIGRPRTRFISLAEPYHGDTVGAVSVGYLEDFHRPFQPLLFDGHRVPVPHDPAALEPCLRELDRIIDAESGHLAGMIVEPLCQGASGMKMYGADYLRGAYERCRAAGILFIVDEIAMGYGRTGRMFAFEHAGIDPDIVTLGKGMAAGYLPVSAAVVRDAVYDTFSDRGGEDRTFYHGHTFAGNPMAAAAALAVLDVYEEEHIVAETARKAGLLEQALAPLRDHAGVAGVRSLGLIGAVEFTSAEPARSVQKKLRDSGVLLRPLGATLYLMPPLVIGDEALVELVDALRRAMGT